MTTIGSALRNMKSNFAGCRILVLVKPVPLLVLRPLWVEHVALGKLYYFSKFALRQLTLKPNLPLSCISMHK